MIAICFIDRKENFYIFSGEKGAFELIPRECQGCYRIECNLWKRFVCMVSFCFVIQAVLMGIRCLNEQRIVVEHYLKRDWNVSLYSTNVNHAEEFAIIFRLFNCINFRYRNETDYCWNIHKLWDYPISNIFLYSFPRPNF